MTVDRKKEIHLAKVNGKINDLYTQDVRQGVLEEHEPEDELAIHRKMLKKMFDLMVKLHGGEIADEIISEFTDYYNKVEKIKSKLKQELEL